jgi:hypothetical protein
MQRPLLKLGVGKPPVNIMYNVYEYIHEKHKFFANVWLQRGAVGVFETSGAVWV